MADYLDRLERLTSLFERGALSKEEFEREKALLLKSAEAPDRVPATDSADRRRKWMFIGGAGALAIGITAGVVAAFDVWQPISERTGAVDAAAESELALTLDAAISFADVSSCTPSNGFAGLLDDLQRAASTDNPAADGFIRIAGSEEALTPVTAKRAAAGRGVALSALLLNGTWQGLHVREVRTTTWDDGVGNGFRIRFAEGPGQAGSVLRQLGMDLPKLGALERRGDRLVGLEADGSGSALVCVSFKHGTDNDSGSGEFSSVE